MAGPAGLNSHPPAGLRARVARAGPAGVALGLLVGQLVAAGVLALGDPALAPIGVAVAVGVSGYALVRHAGLKDPLLELLLGSAVAICLIGLVSVAQVYLEWWHPRVTIGLMLGAGAVASELEILRVRGSAPVMTQPAEIPEGPTARGDQATGSVEASAVRAEQKAGARPASRPAGSPPARSRKRPRA